MNIQRYTLPVSIAAVLHAALLWGIPHEPFILVTEVPLAPLPDPPLPVTIAPPPEDPSDSSVPVQPLPGGLTPPELPPAPVVDKREMLEIPDEEQLTKNSTDAKIVPKNIGPGDLDLPKLGDGVKPRIYSPGELDRTPRAKVQPSPTYPALLHQQGISGSVTIDFLVDTEGRVIHAEAVQYTHREFVEPSVRAVLKWRFEPGRRNNRAVPFRMRIPMDFSLAPD